MAEFERGVDAGLRHRRLEARLERGRMRMSENAEAVMLLAVALVMERE